MGTIHCMFCNGKDCKYENYKLWLPEKGYLGTNGIDGLYSTYITPTILAMQRPSTRLIQEYDLINTFLKTGIKSIFNLQTFGEHASCGDGIEKSGFSYLPEDFIDSGISYYNFGWTDMGTPDLEMV
jgi:protein tyrosine phosphatase domain-containing protein 1